MNRNIRVAIIDSPYDSFQNSKEVRDIMGRLWKLKLDGYKSHYPYGIMPISDVDYFANHIVICEEIQGELLPFASFKSITAARCKQVGIEFPIYDHMFRGCEVEAATHLKATKSWVADRVSEGRNVGYNASWTMCPRVLLDPELKLFMRELSTAMFYYYYTTNKIDNVIASASKTFKVNRLKEYMGFKYLESTGEALDAYPAKTFGDAPFYIMHLAKEDYPEKFIENSEKLKHFWDDRLELGERASLTVLKKAA